MSRGVNVAVGKMGVNVAGGNCQGGGGGNCRVTDVNSRK